MSMTASGESLAKKEAELLANLKRKLPELKAKLEKIASHWGYEDPVYRFYYHSFKVYFLQKETQQISELLRSMAPEDCKLAPEFEELLNAGASGKEFSNEHNQNWTQHTRPIVEAFFHAKYFLEMAVKYGTELEKPPETLPSGWAALLCFYGLR